jgi:hypothetical protein
LGVFSDPEGLLTAEELEDPVSRLTVTETGGVVTAEWSSILVKALVMLGAIAGPDSAINKA